MFFKLQPIIYTLFFLGSLEITLLREDWLEWAAIVLIFMTIIMVWPLTKKARFIALPLFLSLGSLSLFFLVDHYIEKQVFVALSAGVYYLTILGGYRLRFYDSDQTAIGMVNFATLATFFFWFSSSFGWFLNFQIQPWIIIVFFLASSFFISLPSFFISARDRIQRIKKVEKIKSTYDVVQKYPCIKKINILFLAFILAIIISQSSWAITFWPFSYLTMGVSSLIIYYIFWDVVRNYLADNLRRKKIVLNVVFGLLLFAGLLLSAQWELVV